MEGKMHISHIGPISLLLSMMDKAIPGKFCVLGGQRVHPVWKVHSLKQGMGVSKVRLLKAWVRERERGGTSVIGRRAASH